MLVTCQNFSQFKGIITVMEEKKLIFHDLSGFIHKIKSALSICSACSDDFFPTKSVLILELTDY